MDRLLLETVRKGDLQTFLKLIQENENSIKQTVPESGNNLLHLAARYGHVELASYMVRVWPEMVLSENGELETPLHEACRQGHVEVMRLLIATNDGVVCKVNRGEKSVLFVACESGRAEVVKHLLKFPVLLTMEVDALTCSLHVAASAGHIAIVKELLKAQPDFVTKRDSQGCSPLHLACSKGHLEITRELLRLDPDVSQLQDNEGWTPLHWATMKGKVSIIDEILCTSLESVELITNYGETILHLAVKYNQFDTLRYLIETLNVTKLANLQDSDGNTILHIAAAGKLTTMVIFLLKLGVDVNAINRKGNTALNIVESDVSNSGALIILPALQEAGAKRCDQLPPKSQDLTEIIDTINLSTQSSWQKKHVESTKKNNYRRQSHRRAKQIELQNEGLRNARNTITVVAVLIATVTFSSGINPPGGVHQETGKAIMGRKIPFKVFMVCNIMALFLSLGIVNVLVSVIPFRRKSMMKLLVATHKVMWVSTLFMSSAYISASWMILPQGRGSVWLTAELVIVGVGCMMIVFLGLGYLLARHCLRKQEWRKGKKNVNKDGSPNSSINSRVGEMRTIKNSNQESSNSDVDSSDHGYHVY